MYSRSIVKPNHTTPRDFCREQRDGRGKSGLTNTKVVCLNSIMTLYMHIMYVVGKYHYSIYSRDFSTEKLQEVCFRLVGESFSSLCLCF